MTTQQHSPTPWRAQAGTSGVAEIVDANGARIAFMCDYGFDVVLAARIVDAVNGEARLREALRACVAMLESVPHTSPSSPRAVCIESARAALAETEVQRG